VSDKALGIVLAAAAVQAYWALNEVARELEDPYCFPPNDLPLARLQYQFNERILAAANAEVGSRRQRVNCERAWGFVVGVHAGQAGFWSEWRAGLWLGWGGGY
jgi:hypothetical protein